MLEKLLNVFKANPTPKDENKVRLLTQPSYSGIAIPPLYNFDYQVRQYISWVYSCSNLNARSVANTPLRLYISIPDNGKKTAFKTKQIDKDTYKRLEKSGHLNKYFRKAYRVEEVVDDHPFLDLMANINPFYNGYDFLELTQLYLELTGNAYWFIAKDSFGIPAELWIFPSQNMKVVPDSKDFIKGYYYENGTNKYTFETNEIIHFKFNDPKDLYYGVSPLMSIVRSHEINKGYQDYEKSILDNQGVSSGVFTTEFNLSDEEFERIKSQTKDLAGTKKAGIRYVMEKGIKYQALAIPPKDMAYLSGRKFIREEIAAAYGVPLSKLTVEDVNRANAAAGNYQYMSDTIYPRLIKLEQQLNQCLLPLYDDNYFCAFSNPVPEDKEYDLRKATSLYTAGISTLNESRDMVGLDTDPDGDEYYEAPISINPENVARSVADKLDKILDKE